MCHGVSFDVRITVFNLTSKDSAYVGLVIQLLCVIISVELFLNMFGEIFVSYFLFFL